MGNYIGMSRWEGFLKIHGAPKKLFSKNSFSGVEGKKLAFFIKLAIMQKYTFSGLPISYILSSFLQVVISSCVPMSGILFLCHGDTDTDTETDMETDMDTGR